MRDLRGTYVHRGDAVRARRRIRHALIATSAIGITVAATLANRPTPARAEPNELETMKHELSFVRAQFERADKIIRYSSAYSVTTDLAANILDAAVNEGIDPELAFRLVRLESDFKTDAVSPVGAVGLTQLMPSTATQIERHLSREALLDPRTNLRVGFRYLRGLMDLFPGDVRLALLAYNRGEDAVSRDLRAGANPGNGYDRFVMRDYTGTGLIH